MATVLELIKDAGYKCSIFAPGESPSADDAEACFREANRMIGTLNNQRLFLYTVNPTRYTLTAGSATGSLGPGGTLGSIRPQRIEAANLIFSPGANEFKWQLTLTDDDQRSIIQVPSIAGPPTTLYNDQDYPTSTLFFYPVPDQNYGLELWTWQLLESFSNLAQTVVFPAGYEDFFVNELAVRYATVYDRPINPEVKELAAKAKAAIKNLNVSPPVMRTDPEFRKVGPSTRGWYAGPFGNS